MRSFRRVFAFALSCCLLSSVPVFSANRVVVESKTIGVNAGTSIGVHLENDLNVGALAVPLVFRSVTGGAYPSSIAAYYNPSGRLSLDSNLRVLIRLEAFDLEDGSCQGGSGGFNTVADDDIHGVSINPTSDPDAFFFYRSGGFPAAPMPPGSEFPIGSQEPSLLFDLGGVSNTGQFTIDTTCVDPANRLYYVDEVGGPIPVDFTRGVIDVTSCECPHQADIDASGDFDSVDLNLMIQILFFNAANPQDPNCPTWRSDVNADGFPDMVDFQRLALILFYNAGPPCNPCDPDQDLCF